MGAVDSEMQPHAKERGQKQSFDTVHHKHAQNNHRRLTGKYFCSDVQICCLCPSNAIPGALGNMPVIFQSMALPPNACYQSSCIYASCMYSKSHTTFGQNMAKQANKHIPAHRHANFKSELWCCGKCISRRQFVHETDDITPGTYW